MYNLYAEKETINNSEFVDSHNGNVTTRLIPSGFTEKIKVMFAIFVSSFPAAFKTLVGIQF